MVGACGGIGSTVALGLAALRKRRAAMTGLVTALPPFAPLDLIDPAEIVVGGHEIRQQTLIEAVRSSHRNAGLFDEDTIRACAASLRRMQDNVRPGTLYAANPAVRGMADRNNLIIKRTAAGTVAQLANDLTAFRGRHRLDHVVVVHVASSEPQCRRLAVHGDYAGLAKALRAKDGKVLPASSLYALAAVEAGCSFINFTAAPGIDVLAIQQRAQDKGVSFMGRDGKTGETLVKSVLAPMFAWRNLTVRSWVGHNVLGNRDGEVLSHPPTKAAKIGTKDRTVETIVGHPVDTRVSIEYLPSVDDWKVAWDFVHFEGFLGTKMNLQFVWQGSDSVLAAPLIIDLVRLAAYQWRRGDSGPMPHLACFFKAPMGVPEQDYFSQWRRLLEYVERCASEGAPT
jgi:myo-inositol-1-phosphate synthase